MKYCGEGLTACYIKSRVEWGHVIMTQKSIYQYFHWLKLICEKRTTGVERTQWMFCSREQVLPLYKSSIGGQLKSLRILDTTSFLAWLSISTDTKTYYATITNFSFWNWHIHWILLSYLVSCCSCIFRHSWQNPDKDQQCNRPWHDIETSAISQGRDEDSNWFPYKYFHDNIALKHEFLYDHWT